MGTPSTPRVPTYKCLYSGSPSSPARRWKRASPPKMKVSSRQNLILHFCWQLGPGHLLGFAAECPQLTTAGGAHTVSKLHSPPLPPSGLGQLCVTALWPVVPSGVATGRSSSPPTSFWVLISQNPENEIHRTREGGHGRQGGWEGGAFVTGGAVFVSFLSLGQTSGGRQVYGKKDVFGPGFQRFTGGH